MTSNLPDNVSYKDPIFNYETYLCNECGKEEVQIEGEDCETCNLFESNRKNISSQKSRILKLEKIILEASDKLNRNMNFTAKEFLKEQIKEMGIK